MAKKKGSRANRNWSTGGGAVAGNIVGATVGMSVGGPLAAGAGGWAGGIAGGAIARRAYSNRHTMPVRHSNPKGSKGRGGGHGRSRQHRDRKGRFA